MHTSVFQPNGIITPSGMAADDNALAHDIDRCILFSFQQKNLNIHLGVSEIISSPKRAGAQREPASGEIITKREVDFVFLAARFKNDFEAISKVLSLITAAEQNQFGLKHQEFSIGCLVPPSRPMCADAGGQAGEHLIQTEPVQADIFVRKAQFRTGGPGGTGGSGGYGLGLTLGLKTEQRTWSVDMPIFWVHHLKHGLKKALNWIKPTPGIRTS